MEFSSWFKDVRIERGKFSHIGESKNMLICDGSSAYDLSELGQDGVHWFEMWCDVCFVESSPVFIISNTTVNLQLQLQLNVTLKRQLRELNYRRITANTYLL